VKASGAGTRIYFYDAFGNPILESANSQGAWLAAHAFFNGRHVYENTGQLLWRHVDHLGSAVVRTDVNGGKLGDWRYYPFGERAVGSAAVDPYEFTGKERDAETGLDYFGARYYGGALGRFTSPDRPLLDQKPADPQSWNLYAYARNNPLLFVDPTGERVELMGDEDEREKALAAIRAAVGEEAGRLLTIVEEKGGFYLGVAEGRIDEFASVNELADILTVMMRAPETVAFGVVPPGSKHDFDLAGSRTLRFDRPGVTGLKGGVITSLIVDLGGGSAAVPGRLMSDRRPGTADAGILAAHELGHAAYHADLILTPYGFGSKRARGQGSQWGSLLFENMARRIRSAEGPTRTRHD
jgi:RHS repeat-associated protein